MAQLRDSLITGDLRVTGTIYGNATSADKLKTARTIGISGGATGTATSFDGTSNITIPITALDMSKANAGTLPVGRGGTGVTSLTSGNLLVGNGTGAITTIAKTSANTANTVVQRDGSGNFSAGTITASLNGNASSASKVGHSLNLKNGRSFNGSADVTLLTNDLTPAVSKTYSSTTYYGTGDNDTSTCFYFLKVKPDSWYKSWTVRFKVRTTIPGQGANYDSTTWSTITGRANDIVYHNWNDRYDHAHYYICVYRLNQTGFNAGYFHGVGVSIRYSSNYTNSAWYRKFEVDYYDCEGCTVEILDAPVLQANWTGNGSTNFTGVYSADAINRGLRESSDDNTINQVQMDNNYMINSPNFRLPGYTIFGFSREGKSQGISLYSADYASTTASINTARTYNNEGFDWTRDLQYLSSGSNFGKGVDVNVSTKTSQSAVDIRYTDNNVSSAGTTLSLVPRKPVYFRGIIKSDGLFYLAPFDVTYNNATYKRVWTQDIPTSIQKDANGYQYVYWLIGNPYYTYSYYVNLYDNNPIYWFHNGRFEKYEQTANVIVGTDLSASPGNALLQSGPGRTDASPAGDTWLYWDTLGGTSSPWGIRHDQGPNTISFIGGGTVGASITLNSGNSTFKGNITAAKFIGPLQGNADSATALTSNAGSATQPIYFSGGKPVATTYALNKTVPSDAKFTDTTYSAGTGLSLSGTTFNVKLGYTTSGNNRAVQADSNGNLYVVQKDDNTNTDTLVTQTATSTNADYEVLFSATADNRTRTETARKNSNLKFNPSTGNLIATKASIGNNVLFTNNSVPGQGDAILTALGLKTGYPVYTDPTFLSGTNSVGVYNNTSGGAVTITRDTYANFGVMSPGTDSNYILKIQSAGAASPGIGGFVQNISSRANAIFIQIFRALIPTGRNVVTASNSMGTSYQDEWLTSRAGTGKWEWYARRVICGKEGTFSGGGHVYLDGAATTSSAPFVWYVSYCNLYDITKAHYDGLRTRYADNVDWSGISNKPSSFSPSSHTHGNIANDGTTGTANRVVVTDSNKKITTGSIVTDGGYLGSVSYLSVNTAHQTGYRAYINGTTYFNGNTTHNGIDYFANGTTYYINNSAEGKLSWLDLSRVSNHGLNVGTIRGKAVGSLTGEYIHMYERVHIGSPSGWGSRNAPANGLSTYGGAWLATDTGNVGIGTTSPNTNYKLDVNGHVSGKKIYSKAQATDTSLSRIPTSDEIALETGNGNGSISAWIWRENYSSSNWGMFHDNSKDTLHIVGSSTSRLAVKLGNGNVGIGVVDPSEKFQVAGNIAPEANNTRTLGTSSLKWANVYATTFNGALNGNASTATKVNKQLKLANNRAYDGSTEITLLTNDLTPAISKTYESTGYYATSSGSWETSTWYFMSIKPDSWYKPWTVRFKVHTYEPSYLNSNSTSYCTISGREQSFVFANWNERYDIGHYYTTIYPLKKAGFDAGYGHAIGISILYGYNYTSSAHYRTFEVDYYSCDGCTVTLLDTPVKWASWTGTGTTNYNGLSSMNAVDRGLQESGDANSYDLLQISNNFITNGSTFRMPGNTLFGYDRNGYAQTLSLYSADYTGTTTSINTARVYNTAGIDWTKGLFYFSSGTNYAKNANMNVSIRSAMSAVDIRYSDNNVASAGTTLSLVTYKPVYLRGIIKEDGLFYIAPFKVTYNSATYKRAWTQDIPTTVETNGTYQYVYWYIGYPYYTYNYYVNLQDKNPMYWFHNGRFEEYTSANLPHEIRSSISGTSYAYSGGGYHAGYNSLILRGNETYGSSGILFTSSKNTTSINQTSDRAFIQYHPFGITTATAEGTAPTIATSGENGRLVIGIGNDGTDQVWLQSPTVNGLIHQVGATSYVIPSLSGTTTTANYPLISTTTAGLYTNNTSITMNGGTITATTFSGSLSGNAATATALTSSAGSTTQPIYFSSGKPVATTYALKATVNSGTANQVAYYSSATAISSKAPAWEAWVAGTSAGPQAKIQIGNASYTSAAIPSASASASGVVTTGAQTFAGVKTFNSNILLQAASGDSPGLYFIRDGGLTDWRIFVTAGKLSFQSATDASTWTERAYFKDNSGDLVANSFTGNGSALTNLNASNIASGTLAAARLATSGVTAGSYGPSANATPGYGTTFNVPYFTVDSYGRVTAASTKTVKIPAADNTDTKNTAGSNQDTAKMFLVGAKSQTTGSNGVQTYSHTKIYATNGQLDTDKVRVGEHVTFQYNATTQCLEYVFA